MGEVERRLGENKGLQAHTCYVLHHLVCTSIKAQSPDVQLSFNCLYIFGHAIYYVMELGCCLSQVPDLVVHEEEVYEDEDDENDESNWRNDYPDEDSDADSDREERYGGGYSLRCATKACRGKRCTSLFF